MTPQERFELAAKLIGLAGIIAMILTCLLKKKRNPPPWTALPAAVMLVLLLVGIYHLVRAGIGYMNN